MTTKQVAALLGRADFAGVLHEDRAPRAAGHRRAARRGRRSCWSSGPEGGVSPEELAAFAEAGAKPYRLGATVLRTSTAGTAATAPAAGPHRPLVLRAAHRAPVRPASMPVY